MRDCIIDITLLPLLDTAAEQDNEMVAALAEINPIAGTESMRNSNTAEPTPLTFDMFLRDSLVTGGCHLGRGLRVESFEPKLVRIAAVLVEIFANLAHYSW
ncbi:MAG: hypothetical protein JO166_13040 [Deltaproteobacteria bacterium]|nr:hypothetical protein [Deltaproteobacteria bacterium]